MGSSLSEGIGKEVNACETLAAVAPSLRIPPEAAEVEVESWETGEPFTLKLDPTKGPPIKVAAFLRR